MATARAPEIHTVSVFGAPLADRELEPHGPNSLVRVGPAMGRGATDKTSLPPLA